MPDPGVYLLACRARLDLGTMAKTTVPPLPERKGLTKRERRGMETKWRTAIRETIKTLGCRMTPTCTPSSRSWRIARGEVRTGRRILVVAGSGSRWSRRMLGALPSPPSAPRPQDVGAPRLLTSPLSNSVDAVIITLVLRTAIGSPP